MMIRETVLEIDLKKIALRGIRELLKQTVSNYNRGVCKRSWLQAPFMQVL